MYTISFIVPSWHYWVNPLKHQPYWELYYATNLRESCPANEVEVNLVDFRGTAKQSNNLFDVVKKVPERDLYLYWIFKSGDAMELYSIAKILKEMYPNSKHVAGGTHVDMCASECLEHFDAVVVGPGEVSFKRVVDDLQSGASLEKVYEQKYQEVPFKDTPYPKRDFLPVEKIANKELFSQYGGPTGTLVYFSRGCVYHCAFCVYNNPNLLQVRSLEMMRAELAYLKENYKLEAVLLKDEVAIHPNSKLSTLTFQALGEAGMLWRGQTTSRATYDQLKMAKESGCLELAVGVETVDNKVMEIIDKRWQSEKQIREFIDNCKEVGIKVKICFIFGLPGESQDIAEKTIRFLEEAQPEFVSLSGFCPIPGSPMFKDPKRYGIKFIDKNWDRHAHLLYRFSNEEEVGLPFEYEKVTPWGPSFTREQISDNIRQVQRWLESRGMIY